MAVLETNSLSHCDCCDKCSEQIVSTFSSSSMQVTARATLGSARNDGDEEAEEEERGDDEEDVKMEQKCS